jgi:hypothetical protein
MRALYLLLTHRAPKSRDPIGFQPLRRHLVHGLCRRKVYHIWVMPGVGFVRQRVFYPVESSPATPLHHVTVVVPAAHHEVAPVELVNHELTMWATFAVLLFPAFIHKHLIILGLAVAHIRCMLLFLRIKCLQCRVETLVKLRQSFQSPWPPLFEPLSPLPCIAQHLITGGIVVKCFLARAAEAQITLSAHDLMSVSVITRCSSRKLRLDEPVMVDGRRRGQGGERWRCMG